jgi:transposase
MATVFEVRNEVWEVIEPLLPQVEPKPTGRPRVADRVAFNAIVFVLVTGIAWRHLPHELGSTGSALTLAEVIFHGAGSAPTTKRCSAFGSNDATESSL